MEVLSTVIHAWSKKFDSAKYPKEFYLALLDEVRSSSTAEDLRIRIVRLLKWKDGKIRRHTVARTNTDDLDLIQVGGLTYSHRRAKPNTYNPQKHDSTFGSPEFFEWATSIIGSTAFREDVISVITDRFKLWSPSSLVIPAFLAHILNPRLYPLYDQHVERTKRFLMALDLDFRSSEISLRDYLSYQTFWKKLVKDLGLDLGSSGHDEIKKIDDALWAIGKRLKPSEDADDHLSIMKAHLASDPDIKLEASHTKSYLHSSTNVVKGRYDTGSAEFKNLTLKYCQTMIQKKAMLNAAEELGVELPPSYLSYPSSHIDRWRRQGFPKQLDA